MSVRLDPRVVPSNKDHVSYTLTVAEEVIIALCRNGYDGNILGFRIDDVEDECTLTLSDPEGLDYEIKISIKDTYDFEAL